jgi:leucine dehydrogenase
MGVLLSMRECARRKFGRDLAGLTVAVQGLGHVGSALCELLDRDGAKLVVADVRPDAAALMRARFGANVVGTDEIVATAADIFAPCALGAVLDERSVASLRASVVCGAANNVLATAADGDRLANRGVLYAPDYVVNAGGIINVAAEYLGWTTSEAEARVRATGARVATVFDSMEKLGIPSHRAADALASERIQSFPSRPEVRVAA